MSDVKEQLVEVRLDMMRLRARIIHTNGNPDMTALLCGMTSDGTPLKGFLVFDGYDRTWFVSTNESEPIHPSSKPLADDIRKRQFELKKLLESSEVANQTLRAHVSALVEDEAEKSCQAEWAYDKDNPFLPPVEWAVFKQSLNNDGSKLLEMIAKTRLITGEALLPGYYRAKVLKLAPDGKLGITQVAFPSGIDVIAFCERLGAWFPPDDEHTQQVFRAIRTKLIIVVQYGTQEGQTKAQELLKELDMPYYQMRHWGSERNIWGFRLFAKDDYPLASPKGLGEPRRWMKLLDNDASIRLQAGRLEGKHPVLIREIRLYKIWPQVDELEKYLPLSVGEFELDEEQLRTVDQLLATQTKQEREQGRKAVEILSTLAKPTYRLEYTQQNISRGEEPDKEGSWKEFTCDDKLDVCAITDLVLDRATHQE